MKELTLQSQGNSFNQCYFFRKGMNRPAIRLMNWTSGSFMMKAMAK